MTFDDHEREQLRRGLALLVTDTPVAPDLSDVTSTQARSVGRSRTPVSVFVMTGAAVLAVGGLALTLGGDGSELGQVAPSTSVPGPTTPTTLLGPVGGDLPYVIMDEPGWDVASVVYSDEDTQMEMAFRRQEDEVEFRMERGKNANLDSLIADREAEGTPLGEGAALGTEAIIVKYEGDLVYTAIWQIEAVVYEFVAMAQAEAQFRSLLDSLKFVDEEDWLAAMPDSVATDRAAAVDEYLADIPLPPGFDPAPLKVGPVENAYHVGADVVGEVMCSWIERWIAAKEAQDQSRIGQVEDALAGARQWDVLAEMSEQGDFSIVVWDYADAVATGVDVPAGGPMTVEETYQDAFGCLSE